MNHPMTFDRSASKQFVHYLSFGVCVVALLSSSNVACSQGIVDKWRYVTRQPARGWEQVDFDDSQWRKGNGGFGTSDTPGSRIGASWSTNDIWLRKVFSLDETPAKPALLIHHDEDAEVHVNGQLVAKLIGYTREYTVVPIDADKLSALRVGDNVMAVHCRQTSGGQFIDVHLVDGENPPKLPPAKRSSVPFQSELITDWGEKVTSENAWTEYPRPQLKRSDWQNLNGSWDYAVTPNSRKQEPTRWTGKILVPFCIESRLSGVQRLLDPTEALWYRRTFKVAPADGERTILNFEAVDYECKIYVNGTLVGEHVGGNTPFSIDISGELGDGENELVVRVVDETEEWQLRGKQALEPRGIWYTRVSGIWQTVWLEQVPSTYIEDLKITTDARQGAISIKPVIEGKDEASKAKVVVRDGRRVVAKAEGTSDGIELVVDNAKLWSPGSPHLYGLEVSLVSPGGETVDQVESYAGIRTVSKVRNADGHWRFTLNGDPIFHWGTLDQGWWPDGLLTPPSDAAMTFDIEWLKRAGFNMIRKHIKVEPRRYYYHCDRLGMMLWQDHVSGGKNPHWSRLKPGPLDAQWPDDQHDQFTLELEQMVDTLENHPSIVVWVPFNEAWGQHRTIDVGKWMVHRDPSRLVNVASGGNFWPVGDVVDAHKYPHPDFPFARGIGGRFDDYVKVVGEFGGHGFPVKNHLWDSDRRNWGYGGLPKNETEYKQRYLTSLDRLDNLRRQGIAGGVYTQTTDVEGEINGLMTYDRKVIKIPANELAELHSRLYTSVNASHASQRPASEFAEQEACREPSEAAHSITQPKRPLTDN